MTAGRLGAQEHVSLPMCRTDIADYLGLTIHTVSRAISQLCQDNLISLHGPQHFRLLDIAGLRLLAGEEEKVRIEAGEPVLDS
jgi:hypothetical protein